MKPSQAGKTPMGNGDAVAHAGGAEALALEQNVEDLPLAGAGELHRPPGQLLEQLLLAAHLEPSHDGSRRDQVRNIHESLVC